MKFFKYHAKATRSRSVAAPAILLFLLASLVALALGSSAGAVATPVPLGTADPFAVLGGSTVTNTGPSVITGDLGVSPGSAVTGFPPGLVIGVIHAADAVALQAQTDTTTAYNNAAGQGPTSPITADLGGQTLVAGVYNSASSIGLTGTLTLDGQSDPSSVWVFQAGSTLITASGSNVSLINGAQSCNVFWQVGSSATLGTGSSFVGTIMALTSITVTTGVTIDGRALARNGAVTLDTDVITKSTCGVVQPPPPPPPAPPPPPPPAPPPPPPPPPPPSPCDHGTGPLDPNPNSHVGPGTGFHAMLQAISDDLAARSYTGTTASRRAAVLNFLGNALVASRWSSLRGAGTSSPDTSDSGKYVLSQMLMGFKYLTTPDRTLCESAADLRADLIALAGRIADQRYAEVVAAPGGSASLENQAGDAMDLAAGNPMTQVALEQYLRVISLLKNEQPQFT